MVNAEHNIIIREGSILNPRSLRSELFSITGSLSGIHDFKIVLSDDGKTINLDPSQPFAFDEEVTVSISKGMETAAWKEVKAYSWHFTTHPEYSAAQKENFRKLGAEAFDEENGSDCNTESSTRDFADMFTIDVNTDPSPGDIFFDAWSSVHDTSEFAGYHIITPQGDSVFSRKLSFCTDFNLKLNGHPGVYNGDALSYDVLDSNFNVIDSFYPVNGYFPDEHEFMITPDNHVFIVCDENQAIDMTVYDSSYSPNATVVSSVIQEFDASHVLIFEWRSFDYINIQEATHVDLSASYIDFVHTNSIYIDSDGNIIASHRRIDQVTRIDRNTGDFIWRLGGVMNEFTFINEPEPFTFQHDARRIDNGNLTLFDNGNFHVPVHSSAKEYHLDEINKTAELVWSYSHPSDTGANLLFYTALGSVQRLTNGNTFINWGWRKIASGNPNMTEVKPDGTIVWELTLTPENNLISYRARKFDWNPVSSVATPDDFGCVVFPNPAHEAIIVQSKSPFTKISVINLMGQIVFSQNYNGVQNTVQLTTGDIAVGTYFLEIVSKDKLVTKKIMIE